MSNFRELMSQCAKSVFVLATNLNGSIRLTTVSSVVSLEVQDSSPQVLLIVKRGLASELQKSSDHTFSISLLNSDQSHIAQLCSESERRDTDFEMIINRPISRNVIEIAGSIFTLCCKLSHVLEGLTNEVIVADVVSYWKDPSNLLPLVHYRRNYLSLIDFT